MNVGEKKLERQGFEDSCYHAIMPTLETKTIGTSGQISLGKQNAGKTVIVEELETGVWLIKTALVIPESELILHTEPYASRLSEAITWAQTHPTQESDLNALAAKLKRSRTPRSRP